MRIALLSHFYLPTHSAGIEQYTHGLARGLMDMGHQVRVLCCGSWDKGNEYFQGFIDDEWQGVPVRRFRVSWTRARYPHAYMTESPVLARHTRDFLVEFHPDIVHVTSTYTLSTSAIHAAKSLGVPVVFTLCDFWTICPRHTLTRFDGGTCDGRVTCQTCQDCLLSESPGYRILKRVLPNRIVATGVDTVVRTPELAAVLPVFRGWGLNVSSRRKAVADALAAVDCLLAPSAFVRDAVVKTGIAQAVEVLHHGHDLDWLERYTRRQADGSVHIGYIGQLTPIKGVHVLLEAFRSGRFGPRARLYVHGGSKARATPYERRLQEMAQGADGVFLMGPYSRSELPDVLGNLDAIVVPSVWPEAAGLVVQEAFAAGLPVIASRIGGLPEFVRVGEGGLLFEPGNSRELGIVLQRLVDGGARYLAALRAGIPAVRTRQPELEFLIRTYERLVSSRTHSNDGASR